MSQAKVDRYKEEKRNRQAIMKKQKREWMLTKIFGGVLTGVIVLWAGFSIYQSLTVKPVDTATQTVEVTDYTVNMDALEDYFNSLAQ